jgi:hypothetical protein
MKKPKKKRRPRPDFGYSAIVKQVATSSLNTNNPMLIPMNERVFWRNELTNAL